MPRLFAVLFSTTLLSVITVSDIHAEDFQPPALSEFLMEQNHEIALARSAAPDRISSDATIMVLGENGYETVIEGSNSFVCLVIRS